MASKLRPDKNRNCTAVLLSWNETRLPEDREQIDNVKSDLAGVLTDDYDFTVHNELINVQDGLFAWRDLKEKIKRYKDGFEGEDLLLIYYAGRVESARGDCIWDSGQHDNKGANISLNWSEIEKEVFQSEKSTTFTIGYLLILNYCDTISAVIDRPNVRGEVLGAKKSEANGAPLSFSHQLVRVLKELAGGGKAFSTSRLYDGLVRNAVCYPRPIHGS